jgi:hypothetical protein
MQLLLIVFNDTLFEWLWVMFWVMVHCAYCTHHQATGLTKVANRMLFVILTKQGLGGMAVSHVYDVMTGEQLTGIVFFNTHPTEIHVTLDTM